MLKYLSVYVLAIAAAAILCSIAPTQVSAWWLGPNLVKNCGFETGDFTDWTLSGNTDYFVYVAPPGYSGNYSAHQGARGKTENHLEQEISDLVPGGYYLISFWLENIGLQGVNPNNPDSAETNQFDLLFDNVLLQESHNVPEQWWSLYTYYFNATAATHSLKIRFNTRNDPDFFLLDDVNVQLYYY